MRYIISIVWAVLIGSAISYVLSQMANEPFDMTGALALSILFAIAILILGEGVLREKKQ